MKVVAVNGSPRARGNTSILLNWVLAELNAEGVETELVSLAGKAVPGCRACYECYERTDFRCAVKGDIVNECIEKMEAADGILLGSPTYIADVSAGMKALMERVGLVSRANRSLLSRKVGAGVVAVRRGGAIHAFNSLNLFFLITGMIVVGSSYWNIGIGREPGEVENDAEGLRTMKDLGRNMAWLLKRVRG